MVRVGLDSVDTTLTTKAFLDLSRNPKTLCRRITAVASKTVTPCCSARTVRTRNSKFQNLSGYSRMFRRALARSQILRATAAYSPIPPPFYMSISQHLSDAFAAGTYLKDGPPKGDSPSTPPNPMTDPAAMDGMMSGMKTQMVMMVPQMIIMGWINFFFQGFVLSKWTPCTFKNDEILNSGNQLNSRFP
jgi:hypothetical protein